MGWVDQGCLLLGRGQFEWNEFQMVRGLGEGIVAREEGLEKKEPREEQGSKKVFLHGARETIHVVSAPSLGLISRGQLRKSGAVASSAVFPDP